MRRFKRLTLAGALVLAAGTAHADWDRDRAYWDRDRDRAYGLYDRGGWASSDERKERRYERRMDNGIPGDADRLNERLCNNGIPGDAPDGC